jgi:hypothetical protein
MAPRRNEVTTMTRARFLPIPCAVLFVLLGAASAATGQVLDSTSGTLPTPGDTSTQNERLRIQLDRTTVRAFEPLYLAVTAKRFATDEPPELSVWQGDDAQPQPVVIDGKAWVKGETLAGGKEPLQRQGVMLQLRAPATGSGSGAKRSYLFPAAGEYHLRVKVGPTAATLKVKVIATAARERDAWDALGSDVNDIVYNSINEHPGQALVNTCVRIIRTFPATICAGYCQAYISISRFKVAFEQSGKDGGKEVYGPLVKELNRVNKAFADTFLGEQTAFYAAYATGLTHDYNGMLEIADGVKTHLTPFSDGLDTMRAEVLRHIMPRVAPVDPTTLPTAPATAPAK